MNQVDKMLIEYAKLHLQLVISQESIQKLAAENQALQAKIKEMTKSTPTAEAPNATTASIGE